MPLIEGLGDEVTLVMGALLVCVMLVFAWFSTHTTELPALREVGITVIERTQIRRRVANDHSTDQSPGLTGADVVEFVAVSDNALERRRILRLSEDESSISPQDDSSASADDAQLTASPPHQDPPDSGRDNTEISDVQPAVPEAATVDGTSQSVSGESQLNNKVNCSSEQTTEKCETDDAVDSATVENIESSPGFVQFQPAGDCPVEAEVRRRRVQYFQSPAPTTADAHSGVANSSQSNRDPAHEETSISSSESSNVPSNSSVSAATAPVTDSPQQSSGAHSDTSAEQNPSLSLMRIKLKYMNETQRLVHAHPSDTIGHFRRTHFQQELQEGDKWVRFIFNGQDLRNDEATLQAYQISDNCTMHCLITNKRLSPSRERGSGGGSGGLRGVDEDDNDSVMGALMYPLFTLVLVVVWYFRLTYRQYFSPMSTVCLIGISFLLGLGYFSSLRNTAAATATGNQQAATGRETTADQRQANQSTGRRHAHID